MPSPYRSLFATPGARAFSLAGLVGRMPLSMTGIGVVTMISQVTGRYGLAGALSATLALSSALCGPRVSRLVDRYGQRRVLRPVAVVTVLAVSGLLLCVREGAPDWTYFGCVLLAGLTPSLGAMVRARWSEIHRGSPELLHTAYSLESVVDEVVFIVGPVLSVGLCTMAFAEAGPLLAMVFLAVGVALLTAQRATEPAAHPQAVMGGGSAMRSAGLRILCVVFAGVGMMFGAVDVITVAFADERGHKGLASLVLACYALGSCLSGVVFGMLPPRRSVADRFRWGVAGMAVSMIPPLLVGSMPLLALALFVAGTTIAPTMVAAMGLVERLVPRGRLTEGITWTSTGMAVGVAAGAALAGRVIDAHGASAAFAVPAMAAVAAAAAAFLGYGRLRPTPRQEERFGDERDERGGDAAGGAAEPGAGGSLA
ncbi:MFS transporter [Actinacidiphila yeochonensis]|uniref:MFS transporter n=1 Tax=Actinacidiphila yeochonensis TaxID=89050 RepID=UPI00068BD8FA|nr:MFS transporter [Actinacidiphila yeochonensis]